MPRIRSIHPGLFTDEAFMSASPMARILMIGLWTEAWDDGAFEWKPLVIKARVFPADGCDVSELLAELEALNVIKKVERGGKTYGLIRNFRKYQRPRKPNNSGITSDQDVDFLGPEHVALGSNHEPVPNQFRTSSKILPQMEDGGGRKKEPSSLRSDGAASLASSPDFRTDLFRRGLAEVVKATGVPEPKARALIGAWLRDAKDEAVVVLTAIDAAVESRPADFVPWVRRAIESRMSSRHPPRPPPSHHPPRRGSAALIDALREIDRDERTFGQRQPDGHVLVLPGSG